MRALQQGKFSRGKVLKAIGFILMMNNRIILLFLTMANPHFAYTYLLNHCQLCQVAAKRSFGLVMP
jgi:hypothetical protein